MNQTFSFGELLISPLPGWLDVTKELHDEHAPFTLAQADGHGALQFSVATYKTGRIPDITIDALRKLLTDFGSTREFGCGFDIEVHEGPLLVCAESFTRGAQFARVWYCSDRRNIVLVTYFCEQGFESFELPACEEIVAALRFA